MPWNNVRNPEKTDRFLLSSSLSDSGQIRTYKVAEELKIKCTIIFEGSSDHGVSTLNYYIRCLAMFDKVWCCCRKQLRSLIVLDVQQSWGWIEPVSVTKQDPSLMTHGLNKTASWCNIIMMPGPQQSGLVLGTSLPEIAPLWNTSKAFSFYRSVLAVTWF